MLRSGKCILPLRFIEAVYIPNVKDAKGLTFWSARVAREFGLRLSLLKQGKEPTAYHPLFPLAKGEGFSAYQQIK